ncbi:uncharacterized protein FA14DRAFT_172027 [Meira miltonrushii]|uniref:UBA domain-containing protein n=1 Tax=Meira miltonrushii TaxID=1280837 RepID=A0A316VGD3_9BASI|nr:uncharacterized protein FA14DRAFT_172027 [Meira miltonrushii]PWN35383.1 hypothetical protein FA14DRAFT_172027 [Meira miltonrushii]
MDDLLDLDWTKQSGNNTNGQTASSNGSKPYNGSKINTGKGGGMASYNFEALTRSMPSGGNAIRPQQQQQTNASKATTQSKSGNDAFSSLLGFDSSSANTNNATMTMAERMKHNNGQPSIYQAQRKQSPLPTASTQKADAAWDGLDDFMSGSSSSTTQRRTNPQPAQVAAANTAKEDDLWNFGGASSNRQQSTVKSTTNQRSSPIVPAAKKPASKDPFDFSEFEDPADFQSSALGGGGDVEQSGRRPAQAKNGHADNSRTRRGKASLLGDSSLEEDSILGSLGRPAKPLSSTFDDAFGDEEAPKLTQSRKAGTSSPPPHVIGQVVEMGFSPQQARDALSQTPGGQNVQAALEILLQGSRGQPGRGTPNADRDTEEERDRKFAERLQREEQLRQSGRSRDDDDAGFSRRRQGENESSRSETPVDWQKQADQLYAQASVLGANMFSKANALWSTAKTQAQRALDEHNGGSGAGSATGSGRSSPAAGSDRARSRRWAVPSRDGGQRKEWQGKPKWMVDAENEDQDAPGVERTVQEDGKREHRKGSSFRDDFDGEEDHAPPFFDRSQAAKDKARVVEEQRASPRTQPPAADLWGSSNGATSQQRKTSPAEVPQATKKNTTPSWMSGNRSSTPQNGTKVKEAVAKRQRQLIADEAGAIQTASRHKQRGNELFKRGAYGEAEVAYGAALSALDANPRSIRRVVLLNNRANARLKNGDAKGALDDTLAILHLIVVEEGKKSSPFLLFRPSEEVPLPLPEYAEVNLREGYAKALLRRAQAEEMLERWDPALSVWSLLEKYEREEGSGANGVSNMRAAKEGKGRCDKMLKGGDVNGTIAQGPKPVNNARVRAAAASAVAKAEAKVKERLRAENAATAQEEATKDSLRDSVDGRILAWKNGKENNVRALLASLHEVVWPGLGWKKVGMHELVMDNQVKKVYMRAIGRLHPDKLTPKSNTIEERMLGGAVFSVLNDAWSASQST